MIRLLKDTEFKRCTGVRRGTFESMLAVVESGLRSFGRPALLSRADQLLLTLMYWREYRTEFHIGLAYGVSESTACRTIQKVENVLLQSKQFQKSVSRRYLNLKLYWSMPLNHRLNVPKKAKTPLQWQKEMSHPKSTVDS